MPLSLALFACFVLCHYVLRKESKSFLESSREFWQPILWLEGLLPCGILAQEWQSI